MRLIRPGLMLWGWLWACSLTGLGAEAFGTIEAWRSALSNHLGQSRFSAAEWGIQVVSASSGTVLFEHRAGKLAKPASNNKLFTAALVLDRLPSDYRVRTSFYAKKPVTRTGRVRGDLVVFGRGDPSLAARYNQGDATRAVKRLADAVVTAGIRVVEGDLVGDERFYRGPRYGAGWTVDDRLYYYGAEVSALSLEENVVDIEIRPGGTPNDPATVTLKPATDYLRVVNGIRTGAAGSLPRVRVLRTRRSNEIVLEGVVPAGGAVTMEAAPVSDPALFLLHQLRGELRGRGVRIRGGLRTVDGSEARDAEGSDWTEVGFLESPPVAELVSGMMKPSQNLAAQLLFLHVARVRRGRENGVETEELGRRELQSFCREAGIEPGQVLIEEGSGLSRAALVTPEATVRLLRHMARHRESAAFSNSLPIAGVDGTLRNRLRSGPTAGNLRAKTGTLRYVNALSGWVTTTAGEPLVFSVMLNNYDPPTGSSGRAEIDAVAGILARLGVRSGGELVR